MADTQRYSIELKDLVLDQAIASTAVDWSEEECCAAIRQLLRWGPVPAPRTRRYIIQIKDAQTGQDILFTAVDWSEEEKSVAICQIMRWADMPDIVNFPDFDDDTRLPTKVANDD